MKRTCTLVLVLSFCAAQTACHSGGNRPAAGPPTHSAAEHSPEMAPVPAPPPAPAPARGPETSTHVAPSAPAWAIRYVRACEGTGEEDCAGKHGFSASADGRFTIGPGPKGETVEGTLDGSDTEALNAAIHALRSRDGMGTQLTVVVPAPSGPETAEALALRGTLGSLAEKYTPHPFPNPCIEAAFALEQDGGALARCDTDADCAYLDDDFLPVEAGQPVRLTRDDCSYVKPIVVANGFFAVASQRQLLFERSLAQTLCRQSARRAGCRDTSVLDASAAPPVCVQGQCRINPSLIR